MNKQLQVCDNTNTNVETPSEPYRDRVFQVSSNRGNARHRMRYVEASAPVQGECRLCVGTLSERS